jgi:DEAD/DEAH box helicase
MKSLSLIFSRKMKRDRRRSRSRDRRKSRTPPRRPEALPQRPAAAAQPDKFAARRERARVILGSDFSSLANLSNNRRLIDTRDPLEVDDEPSRPFSAPDALDPLDEFMAEQSVIPEAKTVTLQNVLAQPASQPEENDDAYYEEFKRQMNRTTRSFEAVERADELTLYGSSAGAAKDPDDLRGLDYFQLAARFQAKKELHAVDHANTAYPEIFKNIYVQVRELTDLQDHEVQRIREIHGNIKVRGKNAPRPMLAFSQCGLKESVRTWLESRKDITKPFPIQMQAIPALMVGRDVIGIAQTGSGKTLAYMLPLLRHCASQLPLGPGDGPMALVIAPT